MKSFFSGFLCGQKKFGEYLSGIINFFLLSFVYFLGVGLTSLFARIVGKNFLDLKLDNKTSYWEDLNLMKKPKEEYLKQF